MFFNETTGRYKIGMTTDIASRVRSSVGIEDPQERSKRIVRAIAAIEYPAEELGERERDWHQRFAERRVDGEWFDLTPDDVAAFVDAAMSAMAAQLPEGEDDDDGIA